MRLRPLIVLVLLPLSSTQTFCCQAGYQPAPISHAHDPYRLEQLMLRPLWDIEHKLPCLGSGDMARRISDAMTILLLLESYGRGLIRVVKQVPVIITPLSGLAICTGC